jgi:hypothetical protein
MFVVQYGSEPSLCFSHITTEGSPWVVSMGSDTPVLDWVPNDGKSAVASHRFSDGGVLFSDCEVFVAEPHMLGTVEVPSDCEIVAVESHVLNADRLSWNCGTM